MYRIKQLPEDFIVKEINNINLNDSGKYSYFLLKKKNYNTLRAVKIISEKLKVDEKNISFAGNKDRNAITEQLISIKNLNKARKLKIDGIGLEFAGKGDEEIYMGNLQGNDFEITIRNLKEKEIRKLKDRIDNKEILMPNYFGPQRFSKNNHLVGENIVKRDFKRAVDLILKSDSEYNEKITNHLRGRKNDFVVALKIIPLKLLRLYVHAYQSFIFNKTLEQLLKKNAKVNISIPIVGFGTDLDNNKINNIIKKIMDEEEVSLRDFIIREVPELSEEGSERKALIKVRDFEVIGEDNDELNKNMKKLIVKFSLPKGCYATVLIDWLFK